MSVVFNNAEKKFLLKSETELKAYIDVSFENDICYLNYVYVNPALRGQGIGEKIILGSLEILKTQNKKAVPVCGYATAIFNKLKL
jgi:predicted GNAT family acetyltransferase